MAKWGEIKCREAVSKCPRCEELEAEAKIQEVILHSVIEGRNATFALILKRAEAAEAKLAKAVEALLNLADCVDLGCYCSEIQMAAAMDEARATLAELKGEDHD